MIAVIWTLFCMLIAVIPEIAMYVLWGVISPETALERIILFALFWIWGLSFCVFSAVMAFVLWEAGIDAIVD